MAMTEREERASNEGFERGISAGEAKASKERARASKSSSGGGVSAPNVSLKDEQAVTMSLLLMLAVVVIWVSPWGDWLASIVREITVPHQFKLTFNPIGSPATQFQNAATGGGGGSGTGLVHGFNIPLAGGGSITTNSTSMQGAIDNVKSTGATPA